MVKTQINTIFGATLLAWLSLSAENLFADCFTDCMNASGCWSSRSDENVAYCSGTEARCETECRDSRSYGAIAYSKQSEVFGWSHSWNTQQKAEAVALKNCNKFGSGCEVALWFYNSCGAVAADKDILGWAHDPNEERAKQTAIEECTKAGGKTCELKVSHCSH